MDAVIGKITTAHGSVLAGDHHIVVAGSLADSLTDLKGGMVLKETSAGSGVYTPVIGTELEGDAESSCAVLLEDVADSDVVDVESIVVHGTVRKEKLLASDGAAAPATVIAALRTVGIFAV
jgi:hypothetical protein